MGRLNELSQNTGGMEFRISVVAYGQFVGNWRLRSDSRNYRVGDGRQEKNAERQTEVKWKAEGQRMPAEVFARP